MSTITSATSTPTTSTTVGATPVNRLQSAGIVVLAAGIGWLNGNFIANGKVGTTSP